MDGIMLIIICVVAYVIEAFLLSRMAIQYKQNPLLAWIPIVNYFLLRKMAKKKSHWPWLLCLLVLSILIGHKIVLFILWFCVTAWYWSALHSIVYDRKIKNEGLFFISIVCLPLKWYIMYQLGERRR